jgi:uncharacterized protein
MLIDTDVHESPKSLDDFKPYLDPVWRKRMEYCPDPALRAGGSWLKPTTRDVTRRDWSVPGVMQGSDLALMRKHLFEQEGVTLAILDGFPKFQVSTAEGGYEFWTALASAYNDWQIDQWLDQEPRLRGSVHVVADDAQLAALEIDRVAENPQIVQVLLPLVHNRAYGDPQYRPIFEAAVRNDLVVALHHGSATRTLLGFPRYYLEWHTLAPPQAAMSQLASIISSGTFDRLPDLKLVILETGVAWVPWFMWRMDQQYREVRNEVPWLRRLPSEHIRDNVRFATQPLGDIPIKHFLQLIEMSESERVFMFATDYPHYDGDSAYAVLPDKMPEDIRLRIRYKNALETYPRLRSLATA